MLSLLKKSLEEELNIVEWNPTDDQLQIILKEILKLNGSEDIFEIEKIVHRVYNKPIKALALNGLNTSKASVLLAKIQTQSQSQSNQQNS